MGTFRLKGKFSGISYARIAEEEVLQIAKDEFLRWVSKALVKMPGYRFLTTRTIERFVEAFGGLLFEGAKRFGLKQVVDQVVSQLSSSRNPRVVDLGVLTVATSFAAPPEVLPSSSCGVFSPGQVRVTQATVSPVEIVFKANDSLLWLGSDAPRATLNVNEVNPFNGFDHFKIAASRQP